MINYGELKTLSVDAFDKRHSKTLYRSICVPSVTQSYSLCIEFMKKWFLSKFNDDTFKSIYVDGKNIYDDFRTMTREEMIKRPKPALTISPTISWDFTNENIDSYPYGLQMYSQAGEFKKSFFSCSETNSYLGIGLETLLMNFVFRFKVETRAQQLDLYKFTRLACRVGFTCGEDVDLDFHIPYPLMIQLAKDNGFETIQKEVPSGTVETIKNIPEFLRWLNMHSVIPFLYKHRTLNGNNEFFIRMRDMYVHIRPTDLSADDGSPEGQLTNNYSIELNCEVRFPAPKMYAYYSDNSHNLNTIYGAWYQPNGPITTCYTFKGVDIADKNRYGWPLFMSTTYEDDDPNTINNFITIEFSDLLEGEIGECIKDCLSKGLSPAIFCDILFYNGGELVNGKFNWETLSFKSTDRVRSVATYIGVYCDKEFLNDFIIFKNNADKNRLQSSKKEEETG